MLRLRRSLAPFTVLIALAATLFLAATAAAEIRIGEGTLPGQPTLEDGEADLLKASATYDSTAGTATFDFTTRQAIETTPENERPQIQYTAVLVTVDFPCSVASFEAEQKRAQKEEGETGEQVTVDFFPAFEAFTQNKPITQPPPGQPLAQAYGAYLAQQPSGGSGPDLVPGTKTVSGTTTTASVTTPSLVSGPFNCVEAAAQDFTGNSADEFIVFPLTTKPEPPATQPENVPAATPQQPAPQESAPAPAPSAPKPGVLAIAKAKPLKLAAGKWKAVHVTITNSGGSPITQGTLQVKAPKGVVVKPPRQKLPALLPGDSWTVTARVKLTESAKPTSTVTLTATAGALTTEGSLVFKSKG